MSPAVAVIVMSGREDGRVFYPSRDNSHDHQDSDPWTIGIGRSEDNAICLLYDTFISRYHAYIHWKEERWWLEDNNSTNGTAVEIADSEMSIKGKGPVSIQPGQLFRVGRTWLSIQLEEE